MGGRRERSTGILPVFAYHFRCETPVLLSLEFVNVASMLRMTCVCPEEEKCFLDGMKPS
jgi:hypothetical protein